MIDFGGREVGAGRPVLMIAELGTSHQGDPGKAIEMVDAAAREGADCVKLQLVYADEILHPLSGEVDLPTGRIELYRHFKSLEKNITFYGKVKEYAEKRNLLFLCSAFGIRSVRELSSLGVKAIKIASPELNHFPLLREAGAHGVPLILSTGVSKLADIERALEVTGRNVVLLHCVTAYPAPEEEYNLRLLRTLQGIFGVEVGVSDHSLDPVLVPALAVLNGACIIEKHFTLSRSGSGLDDPIALEPETFGVMVNRVRETERAVSGGNRMATRAMLEREYGAQRASRVEGSGIKELAAAEKANYNRTNRSIHAVIEIPEGAIIREEEIAILRTEKKLRPGIGPELLPLVIGARAKRRIPDGEGIVWEDIL